jgi:hypothetical protein
MGSVLARVNGEKRWMEETTCPVCSRSIQIGSNSSNWKGGITYNESEYIMARRRLGIEPKVVTKARTIVHRLIDAGKLVKGTCYVCKSALVEAHHFNYEEPDVVTWLCPKHHGELHAYMNKLNKEGRTQ